MRKTWWILIAALLCTLYVPAQITLGMPAADEQATRSLQGHVYDNNDTPLSEAVVYLKNTKNLTVKTFITQKDGSYRFSALSPNIDYDVFAEYLGRRSDNKTLSSFDSRKQSTINLKINLK